MAATAPRTIASSIPGLEGLSFVTVATPPGIRVCGHPRVGNESRILSPRTFAA